MNKAGGFRGEEERELADPRKHTRERIQRKVEYE